MFRPIEDTYEDLSQYEAWMRGIEMSIRVDEQTNLLVDLAKLSPYCKHLWAMPRVSRQTQEREPKYSSQSNHIPVSL